MRETKKRNCFLLFMSLRMQDLSSENENIDKNLSAFFMSLSASYEGVKDGFQSIKKILRYQRQSI